MMEGDDGMELCMSLNYLLKTRTGEAPRSHEAAARLCATAGFRFVDYTPNLHADDWRERALRDRETLDAAGIAVEQTHAPFNRYGSYDPDEFGRLFARAFEASALMGAKYVVVHADEYRVTDRYDPREIEGYEYESLAPHVDFAAKHGLTMAIENLFEDNARTCGAVDGKSRFTSRLDELLGLIDRFGAPSVGCCWDFGHAHCAFGNGQLDAMRRAARLIRCTHVHDNYYGRDLHLMPFLGEIDWEAHMACLREAGYAGKLSFEFVYGRFPGALLPFWLETLRRTGDHLIALYDNAPAEA